MPNNKSHDELQAEIDALQALKSVVKPVNKSGEDQHRAIDVQIQILNLLQEQPASGESLWTISIRRLLTTATLRTPLIGLRVNTI
jgi:hypothetical protein